MGVKKKISSQGIHRRSLKCNSQCGGSTDKVQASPKDADARVWQVVALIPRGKVATYGQIAQLIGLPSHARFVGRTLSRLPNNTKLPWFRVVNAALQISQRGGAEKRQRALLKKEGVELIGKRIAKCHRWEPGTD